jgi:hypothetical protein
LNEEVKKVNIKDSENLKKNILNNFHYIYHILLFKDFRNNPQNIIEHILNYSIKRTLLYMKYTHLFINQNTPHKTTNIIHNFSLLYLSNKKKSVNTLILLYNTFHLYSLFEAKNLPCMKYTVLNQHQSKIHMNPNTLHKVLTPRFNRNLYWKKIF